MIHILLTLDYEIFGKGTGNVKKHIIKPTEKILQICDKYDIPLTIMFEVNEYMRFEEYNDFLLNDLGYSPANLIKEQILKAFKKGHDVQLHIHPQWVDAEYKEAKWIMKNPKRAITDFSNGKIKEVLREGKSKLENLLKPINPDYECVAMRLTNMGWTEAPEEVIDPMKDIGIKIHSLSDSDNPQNNVKGYWALDSNNEVFEFPIHSIKVPKYKMFTPRRIINALYRYKYTHRNSSEKKKQSNADESKHRYLLSLFRDSYSLKWDFCKQSTQEMINFLDIALERYDYKNNKIPLVMIGHSKNFFNSREFIKFLRKVKSGDKFRNIVKFTKLGDFLKIKNDHIWDGDRHG